MTRNRQTAFKIAAAYAAVGVLWVLLSDRLLAHFVSDVHTLTTIQSYKGWFYVIATSVLIFYLVRAEVDATKAFDDQLNEREAEMRLTFENAPTAIMTSDMNGRLLSANQTACDMLGYSEKELHKLSMQVITHPEDLREEERLLGQCERGELHAYTHEKRYTRKDGQVVHGMVHNGIVHGPDGRPRVVVAHIEDLTRRRKAEEEAREHRERLAHVDRVSLLGEMTAGIAHEINQPLTAIANYADAARRRIATSRADPEKLLSSLEKVSEQAQRAGQVIRRLRSLAKKRESERELCDINELIQDSVKLADVDARIHDISIDLELDSLLPAIFVDPIQIQQVILNLLRNAVDATEQGVGGLRAIRTRTGKTESGIEVSVKDNGTGISVEAEEKLFSPFFTTKRSGMGMGLSISHSIIVSHGGRLWFTRNPDGGTTFHFTLPAAGGQAHG